MREQLIHWLEVLGVPHTDQAYLLIVITLIVLASLLVHLLLHGVVLRILDRQVPEATRGDTSAGPHAELRSWRAVLFGHDIFTRLTLALQGVVVYTLARVLLDAGSALLPVIEVLSHLWIILFALLSVFSVLNALADMAQSMELASRPPLRGIFQGIKLVGAIIAVILAIALLIGKSPLILFSGLGAMTAILLLIFKDPILGLVAGIQLSANDMLRVGDWLEMPQYGADGDVIDISLTTVKVRNWDKTITSIPSYALISDSFKNWRNIENVGGRRIKRAIHIDATSVRFATDEDLERLRKAELVTGYIEDKVAEIETYNREHGIDPSSPVNGRRLTNLGIFRAYLVAYLGANEHINHELTYMVRQLAPGPEGIPLEVYGFANDTSWVPYEGIQSDIFDHVFAVIPEFGLRLHQGPTGHDVRWLGESLAAGRTAS
ncbi:MAG: mechanosensitive ion channel family protein [Halofilum sp. (in: g-proteobacteria)]|nr:mechanosensitive ion channel family protein [Halofilum sp. (in: g-proteobacteria)]